MKEIQWTNVEKMARENLAGLIFNCELNFDRQVDAVAQHLFAMSDVRVVLVTGPSSSGKTTFSNLLCDRLEYLGVKAHYIGLDDFFINRADVPFLPSGVRDYDSLQAIDLPYIRKVIEGVLNAEWVEIPKYDFVTGTRKSEYSLLRLHEQDVVLIEGIHALNPVLVEGFDTSRVCRVGIMPRRTFVMPNGSTLSPDELRLLRRTIRDYYTRNHSFEATAKQWAEVCAADAKHIRPYMSKADYNVDSCYDYELLLYKACMKNLMDACELPVYANIRDALQQVIEVPMTQIPATSLLNEFAIFG